MQILDDSKLNIINQMSNAKLVIAGKSCINSDDDNYSVTIKTYKNSRELLLFIYMDIIYQYKRGNSNIYSIINENKLLQTLSVKFVTKIYNIVSAFLNNMLYEGCIGSVMFVDNEVNYTDLIKELDDLFLNYYDTTICCSDKDLFSCNIDRSMLNVTRSVSFLKNKASEDTTNIALSMGCNSFINMSPIGYIDLKTKDFIEFKLDTLIAHSINSIKLLKFITFGKFKEIIESTCENTGISRELLMVSVSGVLLSGYEYSGENYNSFNDFVHKLLKDRRILC